MRKILKKQATDNGMSLLLYATVSKMQDDFRSLWVSSHAQWEKDTRRSYSYVESTLHAIWEWQYNKKLIADKWDQYKQSRLPSYEDYKKREWESYWGQISNVVQFIFMSHMKVA